MSAAHKALGLAGVRDVSRETFDRLEAFSGVFQQWSRRLNLVASSTGDEFWLRHVTDSAQLLAIKPEARHWVDLGSGGGFPGMVIAILVEQFAGSSTQLVESNHKKAAFLQAAKASVAPSARVHVERLETAIAHIPAPEIVTARALAALTDLLSWTQPWLSASTTGLFHKGRGYREELAESRALWEFDLIEHHSVVAEDSVVLEISNLRRRKATSV